MERTESIAAAFTWQDDEKYIILDGHKVVLLECKIYEKKDRVAPKRGNKKGYDTTAYYVKLLAGRGIDLCTDFLDYEAAQWVHREAMRKLEAKAITTDEVLEVADTLGLILI